MTTQALRSALLLALPGLLLAALPAPPVYAQGLPEGGLPAPGEGFTWERVGDRGLEFEDLTFGPDGTLWANASRGPYRLDLAAGFPGVWELVSDFPFLDRLLVLGRGPEGDTLLGVGTASVRRSTDGGATWEQVHERGGGGLYEVPAGYPRAGRLFASAADGQLRTVVYSDDRGATWTEGTVPGPQGAVADGEAFVALPPGSQRPGRLLAAGSGGVIVTDDGGDKWVESDLWQAVYYSNDAVDVVGQPGTDRHGLVGGGAVTGGVVVGVSSSRVWASADGGTGWDAGAGGMGGLDLPEGPPNDGSPRAVLAVGASSALAVLRGGTVYRTDDAGQTWAAVGRAPEIATSVFANTAAVGPDGRLYVGLTDISFGEGWAWRTTERVTAAVAEVEIPSTGTAGPVTVEPGGGTLPLAASVTSTSSLPLSVEVWAEVEGPGVSREVVGPVPVTLGPGERRQRVLSLRVPAGAPAGAYTVRLRVGDHDGGAWVWSVISTSEAAFEKESGTAPQGAEAPDGDEGWGVSGWHAGARASVGAAVSVWPNPVRGEATVRVSVAEPSVAVFDVLGRRVIMIHEGVLAAGDHAFGLDGASLPPGVYVVRAEAGGGVASRRVTVLQ